MAARKSSIVALAIGASACASLLDLDDLSQDPTGSGGSSEGGGDGGSATGVSSTGGAGGGVEGTGGTGGTGGCDVGQLDCGNGCIDVLADDANCGFCGHSCLGGASCADGMCPSVEVTSAAAIHDIAVDGTDVFWEPGTTANRQIYRTPKTGGNDVVLVPSVGANGQLLVVGDYLVFVQSGFAKLRRVLKTGGAAEDVTSNSSNGIIDVVARGNSLFFTRSSGGLWETNANGCCMVTEVEPLTSPSLVATGSLFAYVLQSVNPGLDVVHRIMLPSGGASLFTDPVSDEAEGIGTMVSDEDHVYWTLPDGVRRKAQLGSNVPTEELIGGVAPAGMVVDPGTAGYVYLLDDDSERLVRFPKTGGPVEPITVVPATTGSELAHDADSLYFVQDDTSLRRVGKPPR